ncbi:hypothetical protein [Hymenobacter weizhouensis]|uniref:hypothetical protein n=1 Tax=Hymenobacter sp. YIM 151500-1 TaxID=2987689 RepID=UPI002226A442|nr:hypothetical protein [Hymenobacter sp. YIM 151500-1]UYZ64871.1 hypothetical protein OIS53_08475 [Hymenobacter sp. YIM 151500-1]
MNQETALEYLLEKIRQANDGNHVDFALPGYAAKNLLAYHGIREDLLLCLDATEELLATTHNKTITASLWYTVIALHGKCFTDASAAGLPKLEKDCFDSTQTDLLATHERLMDLRHRFLAHRGITDNEFGVAYLTMNLQTYARQAQIKSVKRNMPDRAELLNYRALLVHLIAKVEQKFEKTARKAWRHMLDTYTPQELAHLKLAGPVTDSAQLSEGAD